MLSIFKGKAVKTVSRNISIPNIYVEKEEHEKKEEEEEEEGRGRGVGVGEEEDVKKLVMMIKMDKVLM
jgi:hypothetical protein